MPPRRKKATGPTPVEALTHDDKRVNLPTADAEGLLEPAVKDAVTLRYPRNPDLDPQLVWKGKDEQDAEPLEVAAPPLFIQEKIDPRVLIENLRRTAKRKDDEPELTLFETFDGLDDFESVEYYQHAANWSNRLILGDSLEVMASLAERENLRGQVQMIYMDPPYGIKFGSNWQVTTKKRDVKDGKLEDATREVEQIKAFRDTWELGIHSYLAYLRDRFVVARDLLTESGSIFVQIGDENVHLVRALLDEVFGVENFVSQVSFKKTSAVGSFAGGTTTLGNVSDYVVWFAKSKGHVKYRQLFIGKDPVGAGGDAYRLAMTPTGEVRPATLAERQSGLEAEGVRLFRASPLTSETVRTGMTTVFPVSVNGRDYLPSKGGWKTNTSGMERLKAARRLIPTGRSLNYVRFLDDFPAFALTNLWTDTQSGSGMDKTYVVQTNTKVIERCLLMTTDPGDLVLDPTCGSGTSATVSEQWGRRWITVDTSRVAVTLARQRVMAGRFPYYVLADSREARIAEAARQGIYINPVEGADVRRGFVYKTVPHITLKSIANNPDVREGMSREEIDAAIAKHADSEVLYDQPLEDSSIVRVAGPFTVESLAPHRSAADVAEAPESEAAAATDPGQTSFEEMLLENLRESGVQSGRKDRRLTFDSVKPVAGRYLVAEMVPVETGPVRERVAVTIGPRYGVVGADWIKGAAREATKGAGFDVLLVLAFAFDPHALEAVQEVHDDSDGFAVQGEREIGALRVLLVRMNADLAMGEKLLKKSKNANLFTVFGEPDVEARRTKDGWVVEVKGFDIYNPVTGEVESGDADDIAMWMLDTDYDEQSFFVRHAYFPGRQDPYTKLKKALKADIDEAAWDTLNSPVSRPFPTPSTGKVAVKVINDYGDEVIRVLNVRPAAGARQPEPDGSRGGREEETPEEGFEPGTVGYFEARVWEVEGFIARVLHDDGTKVRADKVIDVVYDYVNRAPWDYTVADWAYGRFNKHLPDLGVEVLWGDGTVVGHNAKLVNVRDSYDSE